MIKNIREELRSHLDVLRTAGVTLTMEVPSFPKLKEAEAKLAAKAAELKSVFDEAGPDRDMTKVKSISGDTAAKVDAIRKMNEELDALGRDRDDLVLVAKAAANADRYNGTAETLPEPTRKGGLSIGEAFTKSAAWAQKGQTAELDVELKTLMTTAAGWAPESVRSGLVVDSAQRPIQVTDLIPMDPITQAAYVYMEETTFTNNAAEAAEAGTYGEAALVLTQQTSTVRKVGVWIPVTDEQLEDVDGITAYLNRRLPFMVRQRLDSQILVGNGTAPNLRGINNVVGIQTQAKGADPVPDAVYKGMTKVRVTGRAMPSAAIFHPNDWQDVRLLRTADGIYIWGNPSESGPERIWGIQVVQSDAQTENTAVVGDFANFSLLSMRRGLEIQTTNSHSTFFVEGKQAIRADLRCALTFLRPAAFATVTGI
jgi:HK97 family phage major capsid protein